MASVCSSSAARSSSCGSSAATCALPTGGKKYIISSEPEFEHYFGKQATKKRKLYNGRLQCNVYMYF